MCGPIKNKASIYLRAFDIDPDATTESTRAVGVDVGHQLVHLTGSRRGTCLQHTRHELKKHMGKGNDLATHGAWEHVHVAIGHTGALGVLKVSTHVGVDRSRGSVASGDCE